jgi:putative hemolysin
MEELLALALGFIIASGILAMIDSAILSVNPAEVEVMIAKKRWGAKELKLLLRHTTRAIIVIVILTNIVNILGPILVGRRAEQLFGSHVIGIVTAILTFLTIIFSEIIPKGIGTHYAPKISRRVAPFLRVLVFILYPVVIVLERMVRMFKSGKRKVGTEEQIRALANLGGGAGHIDADERELIHRAFSLNDRTARDIMVSASAIVFIQKGRSIRQAAKMIFEHTYSRYPVIGHSLHEVEGYILSHDALEMLADGNEGHPITEIIRPVPMVDADMRCDDLLTALRKSKSQFAIVRQSSQTVGLVTLEDVLEELIGQIREEGDGK